MEVSFRRLCRVGYNAVSDRSRYNTIAQSNADAFEGGDEAPRKDVVPSEAKGPLTGIKPKRAQIEEAKRLLGEGATFAAVAKALGVNYKTLYARVSRQEARSKTAAARIQELEEENELLRASIALFDAHENAALAEVLTSPSYRKKSGAKLP